LRKIKKEYYSKEILKYILLGGVIIIASSSPYFVLSAFKNISKFKKVQNRKISNSFEYLKRSGFLEIRKSGHDIEIQLTKKGKERAGKYQIDSLQISEPKKWDKKWRIVIFDIPDTQRFKRNVFRGKIKEFGFVYLQKSVWIYPYNCEEEVKLLRDFLGIKRKDIQIITAEKIDNEEDFKEIFKL